MAEQNKERHEVTTRRRRRAKRESSRPLISEKTTASEQHSDGKGPTFSNALGGYKDRPIPSPLIAVSFFAVATILALKFPSHVICPQDARGFPHVVASVALGLPIGFGLASIAMTVGILSIVSDRGEHSTKAIRVATERAGIGAIYGTYVSVVANLVMTDNKACGSDLLAGISDGATWGTMLGLMFSVMVLRRGMFADFRSSNSRRAGIFFVNSANASLLFGLSVTAVLIWKLLQGVGWPQ